MRIKFQNEETIQNGIIRVLSDHVVEVTALPKNLSGFALIDKAGKVQGDYASYTSLYRKLEDDVYQYSDDGSVYTPPPEPEPYEPTLDELREQKVAEMNSAQQTVISNGVEVELADGTKERFTLTDKDQLSLTSLSVKGLEGSQTFPWHPADESVHCKFYSEENMKRITDACAAWVIYHVTYFRDLRIYIRSIQDKETLAAVEYGMVIPEAFQCDVLKALLLQQSGGSV